MDMREDRIMAVRDGRRLPPRNSRGEFRRRRSRRDRGMDYGDMTRRGRYGDYGEDMARGGRGRGRSDYGDYDMRGGDYARSEMSDMDMRGDYRGGDMGDMARGYDRGYDGHHGMHGGRQGGYEPVEFMGYCSGYYGSPDQDYGYDMRGMDYRRYGGSRMDYARGRGRDYGYDDYGDYGETLSEKEMEEWCHKLKAQLSEQEKQMFSKEAVMQRARAMGKPMEGFGEKELEVATLMVYTDYKQTIGQNPDLAVKLAYDWLTDKDVKVKGAEKLAVYYDEIVMGGEDD